MERILKAGDIEIPMKSSAAIPHLYRRKFNRDVFADFNELQKNLVKSIDGTAILSMDSLEMFESLAYCFAKHADPNVPDDPQKWLEQFEFFDIYNLIPEVLDLWTMETKGTSVLKKKQEK